MKKITTIDLVNEISDRMGCFKKDARELLGHFTDVIIENISEGRSVQLASFGVFIPAKITRGRKTGGLKIKLKQSAKVTRFLAGEAEEKVYHTLVFMPDDKSAISNVK